MSKTPKKPRIRPTEVPVTDDNRFWMVSTEGCKGPRTRFNDFTVAYSEAVRLALITPGKDITVMESVGSVISGDRKNDIEKRIAKLQIGKEAIERLILELKKEGGITE